MKESESREKRILLIAGAVMIVTELIKQLLLTFVVGGGCYQWWYFPWQLCSIPMYVCLIAGLCNSKKIYNACLAFLSDFGLLAGICSFLDTSGFQYPLVVLTVHSYLWHFALIAIGIYVWTIRARDIKNRRSFLGGLCIYAIGCIAAEIINVIAFDSGYKPINMFYISPRYLMAQIYIRDMVPAIGNTACIFLYIAVTILGATLIELIARSVLYLVSNCQKRYT